MYGYSVFGHGMSLFDYVCFLSQGQKRPYLSASGCRTYNTTLRCVIVATTGQYCLLACA